MVHLCYALFHITYNSINNCVRVIIITIMFFVIIIIIQWLPLCLVHRKHSINTYWKKMNEWIQFHFTSEEASSEWRSQGKLSNYTLTKLMPLSPPYMTLREYNIAHNIHLYGTKFTLISDALNMVGNLKNIQQTF